MNYLAEAQQISGHLLERKIWLFTPITIVFAVLGRLLRGVTTGGAIVGAIVCFSLLCAAGIGGFIALFTVFLLTWASTRFGYSRKQKLGTAEPRTGRDALQVAANLGVAAVCALATIFSSPNIRLLVAMSSALAEAAADTVSSEIGQAVGGRPRLITNWRLVAPGTNGAVSLPGTAAGVAATFAVAATCWLMGIFGFRLSLVCAASGIAGMVADSFLGSTLEQRGVLENNGVNFISTLVAASIAVLIS